MPKQNPERTKRTYSDQEKGYALAQLEINGGNVKGTARATGIPWETLRTWKSAQERLRHDTSGTEVSTVITPTVLEYKEKGLEGFLGSAEVVRDQAIDKLKILIPQAGVNQIGALTTLVKELADRIDRAKGISERHVTVEHQHKVGPSEEWVEAMANYAAKTREDAIERAQEIIDVDVVEQPVYLGLSATEGEDEDG